MIPIAARRRRLLIIAWYVGATTIAALVVAVVVAVNNQTDDMRCSTSVPAATTVPDPLVLLNSPLPPVPGVSANVPPTVKACQ